MDKIVPNAVRLILCVCISTGSRLQYFPESSHHGTSTVANPKKSLLKEGYGITTRETVILQRTPSEPLALGIIWYFSIRN